MKTQLVHVGTIGKPHGVRGLVHLYPCVENPQDLEAYGELVDDRGERWTISWQSSKVAALYDSQKQRIDNRTIVEKLTNRKLFIPRDSLPEPEEEEFYFNDLIGLQVKIRHKNKNEEFIGTVHIVHDYGAGVSLEIKRNQGENILVPFTKLCVPEIDVNSGWLLVCPPNEVEVRPSDVKDKQ